ncbi:MAG: AMP-binding enzyme, partial [Ilumatobacteraceae bacterium]
SVEVEAVISAHPDVAQVAIVGVPHDDWGEAVHAVVVPRPSLDRESFVEWCRSNLATYKRPKSIEYRDDLPVTVYGKVDKKALRAPHWDGRQRNVG